MVVFIDLLYINFICVLDDDPPSSPVTEQIELSELMPLNSLSNKSPGSHSDSGYSTLTMEHTGSETYKSRTIEVCEKIVII